MPIRDMDDGPGQALRYTLCSPGVQFHYFIVLL